MTLALQNAKPCLTIALDCGNIALSGHIGWTRIDTLLSVTKHRYRCFFYGRTRRDSSECRITETVVSNRRVPAAISLIPDRPELKNNSVEPVMNSKTTPIISQESIFTRFSATIARHIHKWMQGENTTTDTPADNDLLIDHQKSRPKPSEPGFDEELRRIGALPYSKLQRNLMDIEMSVRGARKELDRLNSENHQLRERLSRTARAITGVAR